jgi:ABC-type transport system involved in cytochrome c biogenesis permease subunit
MLSLSQYCVFAGIVAVSLALICYVLAFAYGRIARARVALAVQGSGGEVTTIALTDSSNGIAVFGTLTTWLALAFLSAALFFRWRATGHGPFANMYEFSVAFAWGALVVNAYFLRRYREWSCCPSRWHCSSTPRRFPAKSSRSCRRFRTTCC